MIALELTDLVTSRGRPYSKLTGPDLTVPVTGPDPTVQMIALELTDLVTALGLIIVLVTSRGRPYSKLTGPDQTVPVTGPDQTVPVTVPVTGPDQTVLDQIILCRLTNGPDLTMKIQVRVAGTIPGTVVLTGVRAVIVDLRTARQILGLEGIVGREIGVQILVPIKIVVQEIAGQEIAGKILGIVVRIAGNNGKRDVMNNGNSVGPRLEPSGRLTVSGHANLALNVGL
ncbi:MAG: hypothetical protein LBP22_13120 [Deltaproteobacteria bacterium]|jgi:hypothetical protein|nr:hypothetical protein [Deltaproteobacteria bacterium]